MQLMSLEEYLSKYSALYELYMKTLDFLPTLKEKKILVKLHEPIPQQAVLDVSRDLIEEDVWYVGFSEDPPTPIALLQALIYIETGDRKLAQSFSYLILYAINKNLPPFNLLDLFSLDLKTINKVLEKLYRFKSVEDYFTFIGLVPLEIAHLDHDTMTVKLNKDIPEDMIVRVFIEEMASSVSMCYKPEKNKCIAIECPIFEELALTLSKRKQ
ncbi:MAG: hypothetical protein QXU08_09745 [Ignisphaera sp.]